MTKDNGSSHSYRLMEGPSWDNLICLCFLSVAMSKHCDQPVCFLIITVSSDLRKKSVLSGENIHWYDRALMGSGKFGVGVDGVGTGQSCGCSFRWFMWAFRLRFSPHPTPPPPSLSLSSYTNNQAPLPYTQTQHASYSFLRSTQQCFLPSSFQVVHVKFAFNKIVGFISP